MKIQILGTGCSRCERLAEVASEAAEALGKGYELEKVKDIQQILSLGVLATPAMVVDGVVKVMGRVPSLEEMKQLLGA